MSRLRLVTAISGAQLRISYRSIEDLTFLLVMPLQTLVSLAVLIEVGRLDLAGYALTSALLFTVGQMGFFVGSELVARDRDQQVLELLVATPVPYFVVLGVRTILMTVLGLIGFVESWLIAYFFHVTVVVYHPVVFFLTLLATSLAGGGTAILTSALFSLARTTRTLQNAINGPLYLLGGVLVPVSFLPVWVQPISKIIFLYWSADLIRDALKESIVQNFGGRLGILIGLGLIGAISGVIVLNRMLHRLREEGRMGLV